MPSQQSETWLANKGTVYNALLHHSSQFQRYIIFLIMTTLFEFRVYNTLNIICNMI